MRFDRFAYGIAALTLAALAVGCSGAARAPRTVRAVEIPAHATVVAPEARSPAVETREPAPTTSRHVVQPGETAWSIAGRYGTTVDELARVNRLDDPSRLEAGRALIVPGTASAPSTPVAARRPSMRWPVPGGRVLSAYGVDRRTHTHRGVDIAGRHGDPVVATADGVVVYSGATMRGYGKTIILDHGDGLSSLYAHGSRLLVEVGERVRAGQAIARIGRTGNATADHCHFEIREHDRPVDPARYVGATETASR